MRLILVGGDLVDGGDRLELRRLVERQTQGHPLDAGTSCPSVL